MEEQEELEGLVLGTGGTGGTGRKFPKKNYSKAQPNLLEKTREVTSPGSRSWRAGPLAWTAPAAWCATAVVALHGNQRQVGGGGRCWAPAPPLVVVVAQAIDHPTRVRLAAAREGTPWQCRLRFHPFFVAGDRYRRRAR